METTTATEYKHFEWLHQLTVVGCIEDIIIDHAHANLVDLYYEKGLTPAQALARYKKFKTRWNALQAQGF